MFVDLMAAMKSVRDHAAGKIKLKTTTVVVPAKLRRVAAKKAARPSRSRKSNWYTRLQRLAMEPAVDLPPKSG